MIKVGQKVKVYFNLHKKLWSVQDAKSRLVIAHLDEVSLRDVEFKVSEAGRQRVLKEQRKNVHAFAVGTLDETSQEGLKHRVSYNPYRFGHFYMAEKDGQPTLPLAVHKADSAFLSGRAVWI